VVVAECRDPRARPLPSAPLQPRAPERSMPAPPRVRRQALPERLRLAVPLPVWVRQVREPELQPAQRPAVWRCLSSSRIRAHRHRRRRQEPRPQDH